MFQLSAEEWKNQRSQFVIFNKDIRKYRPFVFTEHGILMLSSVLNSDKDIKVNISIMRAFVQLRYYVLAKPEPATEPRSGEGSPLGTNVQIAELRKLLMLYIEKNDKRVNDIIIALNNLIGQPKPAKRIGFNTD